MRETKKFILSIICKCIENFCTRSLQIAGTSWLDIGIAPPLPHFSLNFKSQRPWLLGALALLVAPAFPLLLDDLVTLFFLENLGLLQGKNNKGRIISLLTRFWVVSLLFYRMFL